METSGGKYGDARIFLSRRGMAAEDSYYTLTRGKDLCDRGPVYLCWVRFVFFPDNTTDNICRSS